MIDKKGPAYGYAGGVFEVDSLEKESSNYLVLVRHIEDCSSGDITP
jgi:hypothetical protein